jgi:hypothetical protein
MMLARRKSSGTHVGGHRTGPCRIAVRDRRDGQDGEGTRSELRRPPCFLGEERKRVC